MSGIVQERTRRTCDLYRAGVDAGEPTEIVGRLARAEGVARPAIWKRLISGGERPSYGVTTREPIGRAAGGVGMAARENRENLPPVVDRDPCQRCGVRADFGCAHTRVPVGMMFGMGR